MPSWTSFAKTRLFDPAELQQLTESRLIQQRRKSRRLFTLYLLLQMDFLQIIAISVVRNDIVVKACELHMFPGYLQAESPVS